MDIIKAWQAKTPQEQTDLHLTNIKKAMLEQIPAARRTMYEPQEFLGAAWERINKRFTALYLDGTNDERAESGKKPITLVSLVFRCCKDAIREIDGQEGKHEHAPLDWISDEDRSAAEAYYLNDGAGQRRRTEEHAIRHVFWGNFERKLDSIDRLIVDGLRRGYQQNECAKQAHISAPAVNKRIKKLRTSLEMAAMA